MVWLYRLQQRLSITRNEGLAVVTLSVLFFVGLVVRHVQKQQIPPLEADSLVTKAASAKPPTGKHATPDPAGPSPANPLNVNEASGEELEALDGIGPALSDRIVEYRSTQRPFQRVRELRRVRGIGPATVAEVRDVVVVESSTE